MVVADVLFRCIIQIVVSEVYNEISKKNCNAVAPLAKKLYSNMADVAMVVADMQRVCTL